MRRLVVDRNAGQRRRGGTASAGSGGASGVAGTGGAAGASGSGGAAATGGGARDRRRCGGGGGAIATGGSAAGSAGTGGAGGAGGAGGGAGAAGGAGRRGGRWRRWRGWWAGGGRGGSAAGGTGGAGIYVPPTTTRTDTLINTGWKHLRMDNSGAPATAFDDTAWASVTLPHTWNATDGQDGGNNYYRGIGWYRRHYTPPASAAGKRIFLQFDGANIVTDVYVNGTMVGSIAAASRAFASTSPPR